MGRADSQAVSDDAWAFDEFCEATPPVLICDADLVIKVSVGVHVLTHKGAWISATATRYGGPDSLPDGTIWIDSERDIKGGTSGGPVIDGRGQLVGVVSSAGGTDGKSRKG